MKELRRVVAVGAALLLSLGSTAVRADSITYSYDLFGRVVTAVYSSGVTVTYTYDGAGNRTAKTVTSGTAVANPALNNDALTVDAYASGYPSAGLDPTANDYDPYGYPLTITSVTNGSYGTVSVSGNIVTYHSGTFVNPTGGAISMGDTDNFTYTVTDGHGGTATGSVFVQVVIH